MKIRISNFIIIIFAILCLGGVVTIFADDVVKATPVTNQDDERLFEESMKTVKDPFLSKLPVAVPVVTKPVQTNSENAIQQKAHLNAFQPKGPGQMNSFNSKTLVPPKAKQAPSFQIDGVVWNTDKGEAIIDGKIVNVGDKIQDSTIVAIRRSEVVVTCDGKTYTLGVKK